MAGFATLADEFLASEFALYPTRASNLGLTEFDDRSDDLSAAGFERRDEHAAEWLSRFEDVADRDLDDDQQIDRDLAIAQLRGRVILIDWQAWRRDPVVYTSPIFDGIFRLLLHRLRPEPELAEAVVRRLGTVASTLRHGRENLDATLAHRLIVERGAGSARGGVRYLRQLLPAEFADAATRDRVAKAARPAADALEGWISYLDDLAGRATGTWQLGEERYSRLLRERESLADDARSLRDRGQAEYDRLDAEMREIAREISGDEDWVGLLERAAEDHPPTEEAMRESYAEWTATARAFLSETGLVTIPDGERCLVEPSPVFQRPILGVASYVAPPMYSDTLTGHFFVPFAPDGTSPDEVQKRLAGNSHGGIPTTAVHEAYPGHHWHLTMMKSNPSRLRRAFGTPYFSEGWALYGERLMRERGFFRERLHELYHLNATIFRAARIVVDTSLHLGEMSHDEAVRFMVEKAALPEPTAKAEVGRYCWWPTQASAYLTGCLEMLAIRDDYLAMRGFVGRPADAPIELLREFHDRLTSAGSLPLGLARRAALQPIPA
jgi:uncharacterized protein (DUF885 family)